MTSETKLTHLITDAHLYISHSTYVMHTQARTQGYSYSLTSAQNSYGGNFYLKENNQTWYD